MKNRFLALALLGLVTACGPVYQTNYEMVPPPTEMGRACANNCLLMKQNCAQTCYSQQQQCHMTADLKAQNAYQQYVIERQAQGKEIKKTRSSFDYYGTCSNDSCGQGCESNYHICHTNCGGQIIPHTVCTANCQG